MRKARDRDDNDGSTLSGFSTTDSNADPSMPRDIGALSPEDLRVLRADRLGGRRYHRIA